MKFVANCVREQHATKNVARKGVLANIVRLRTLYAIADAELLWCYDFIY